MKPHKSLAAILTVALACLFLPPLTQAQVEPTTVGSFTLPSTLVSASATSNVLSAVVVRPGKAFAVAPLMAAAGASTANVIFTFDLSADGTNYTTVNTISKTNALDGTTAVRGYHVITADAIGPARYIRLKTMANGYAGNIWVTNVIYAWPNN